MKTEVYSWRVSTDLKSELEREARLRKSSISSVLESAIREWLSKRDVDNEQAEVQERLHAAAASCFGVLAGRGTRRAETARQLIRQRLRRRYAR